MPRGFWRNTQVNPGAGGTIYDLNTVQGTSATLPTDNLNSTAYTQMLAWQLTPTENPTATSFPFSFSVSAVSGTVGMRIRVQRVNSSNVVQASSAYSSVFSGTGTKTGTLTLSTTWAAGDRIRVALEIARTGGHGNVSATLNVNNAATYIDWTAQVTHLGAANLSALANLAADAFIYLPPGDRFGAANLSGVATLTAAADTGFRSELHTDFNNPDWVGGYPPILRPAWISSEAAHQVGYLRDLTTSSLTSRNEFGPHAFGIQPSFSGRRYFIVNEFDEETGHADIDLRAQMATYYAASGANYDWIQIFARVTTWSGGLPQDGYALMAGGNETLRLYRIVAGSFQLIASVSVAGLIAGQAYIGNTRPYTLRLRIDGDRIRAQIYVYQNDATDKDAYVIDTTDATYASGLTFGVGYDGEGQSANQWFLFWLAATVNGNPTYHGPPPSGPLTTLDSRDYVGPLHKPTILSGTMTSTLAQSYYRPWGQQPTGSALQSDGYSGHTFSAGAPVRLSLYAGPVSAALAAGSTASLEVMVNGVVVHKVDWTDASLVGVVDATVRDGVPHFMFMPGDHLIVRMTRGVDNTSRIFRWAFLVEPTAPRAYTVGGAGISAYSNFSAYTYGLLTDRSATPASVSTPAAVYAEGGPVGQTFGRSGRIAVVRGYASVAPGFTSGEFERQAIVSILKNGRTIAFRTIGGNVRDFVVPIPEDHARFGPGDTWAIRRQSNPGNLSQPASSWRMDWGADVVFDSDDTLPLHLPGGFTANNYLIPPGFPYRVQAVRVTGTTDKYKPEADEHLARYSVQRDDVEIDVAQWRWHPPSVAYNGDSEPISVLYQPGAVMNLDRVTSGIINGNVTTQGRLLPLTETAFNSAATLAATAKQRASARMLDAIPRDAVIPFLGTTVPALVQDVLYSAAFKGPGGGGSTLVNRVLEPRIPFAMTVRAFAIEAFVPFGEAWVEMALMKNGTAVQKRRITGDNPEGVLLGGWPETVDYAVGDLLRVDLERDALGETAVRNIPISTYLEIEPDNPYLRFMYAHTSFNYLTAGATMGIDRPTSGSFNSFGTTHVAASPFKIVGYQVDLDNPMPIGLRLQFFVDINGVPTEVLTIPGEGQSVTVTGLNIDIAEGDDFEMRFALPDGQIDIAESFRLIYATTTLQVPTTGEVLHFDGQSFGSGESSRQLSIHSAFSPGRDHRNIGRRRLRYEKVATWAGPLTASDTVWRMTLLRDGVSTGKTVDQRLRNSAHDFQTWDVDFAPGQSGLLDAVRLTGTSSIYASPTQRWRVFDTIDDVPPSGDRLGAASLEAVATLVSDSHVLQLGAATLAAEAQLTATATLAVLAEATLTATATLSASATSARLGAATLTSTATLQAAGRRVTTASTSIAATATLSALGVRVNTGAMLVAGLADLTATGHYLHQSPASLAATATLTAAGLTQRYGAATLAASAQLAADGHYILRSDAGLSASAALTAAARRTTTALASLNATATLASDSLLLHYGAATLAGTAQLEITSARVALGTSAMAASATLAAAGTRLAVAASAMTGEANLAAIGVRLPTGAATLAATATVFALGVRVNSGAMLVAGLADLTATGRWIHQSPAQLTASATLSAQGTAARGAGAALTATAALTAQALRTAYGEAALGAQATLTATGVAGASSAAQLPATATLAAQGSRTTHGAVTLPATAALGAQGLRTATAAATLGATSTTLAAGVRLAIGEATAPATATFLVDAEVTAPSVVGAATLQAEAQLAATGSFIHATAGVLAATATLDATASFTLAGEAELAADATFTAVGETFGIGRAQLHATALLACFVQPMSRYPRGPRADHYNPHNPEAGHEPSGGPSSGHSRKGGPKS